MIEIKNLQKRFSSRTILEKINLTFEEGKIYALIGKSGSGKSTLLNIIAKLVPYDDGLVEYGGKDIKKINEHVFYREYLGYLFQHFGLIENETIGQNLELGFIGQKLSKKDKLSRKLEVLEKVNLSHLSLDQKIYELSGGEAQRVALAKIFLKNPPLILADEPTAALDPVNSQEVIELLTSLKTEDKIIIIATHNPAVWEKADVVVRMEDL
ncbi:TPA: ABC transporter ATP-binding protein [Streptococcus suis]|uniref:ABC transporter ATP-binding protein n=1 Tax=Streptococcus suis TaxID=1307 RepID=UPI001ABE6893|nr:ABC transporter ATP-binding protein [Streptococcus suis]MBO4109681.1 ABC transporter ATP-binding protein [Streptococcus suis]HEM3614633.1 ABC transporter ATP-binding protein [Streptococcus suis]HEM3636281.1 ABC transporter ATP-binding protein [Streptococcus suis]HEM3641137.1 ABC transporter ATP-binding protein [Streptococcus suis]HEM3667462.1 ABC transporter ATP-binding protein [Streptococcus suis]